MVGSEVEWPLVCYGIASQMEPKQTFKFCGHDQLPNTRFTHDLGQRFNCWTRAADGWGFGAFFPVRVSHCALIVCRSHITWQAWNCSRPVAEPFAPTRDSRV